MMSRRPLSRRCLRSGLAALVLALLLPGLLTAATAPVQAECTLYRMGCNISGCGMLATYAAPGPGTVTVVRSTILVPAGQLPPITLVKVVDPRGHTAAWVDLTYQSTTTTVATLTVPAGPAGIWRFSVQGGQTGDLISFTLPPATQWGLRGEMALGLVPKTGISGWLWIPRGDANVLMEAEGGGTITVTSAGKVLPGTPCRSGVWRWTDLPQGAAVQVSVSSLAHAFVVDGAPGLLCPNAATAQALAGGTSVVAGRLVEGPLQARAVAWMAETVGYDLDPQLEFPKTVAANQAQALASIQLYGGYGPLSGLKAVCAAQLLNPSQATCGSFLCTLDTSSLHGADVDPYDCLGLTAAVTADVPENPAQGNRQLIDRAVLLACYHIARLQGDDLMRESDISVSDYPMSHSFFDYMGSITVPYELIKPQLDLVDPTASGIWRDATIAISDRFADFHGYETNQFWHVVLGQVYAHLSTGEYRYRTWFERHVEELLGNLTVPNRQWGQAQGGFFIEDWGPDGNYDAISATCLSDALHTYRTVKSPMPALLTLMTNALTLNLGFTSCHWLPQPDGAVVGPTAMMSRQLHSFADQAWPGTRLARDTVPMAAAHWLLAAVPTANIGDGGLFPYRVNDAEWASRTLVKQVLLGDTLFSDPSRGVPAPWTMMAIGAAQQAVLPPATIPCRTTSGQWALPGQIAWKDGGLYGLCFYDAPGATDLVANCRTGGAPSALWTEATGAVLLSSHNTHYETGALGNNGVATTADLTHTCIYGDYSGSLWWSGCERCALTRISNTSFSISGAATTAPAAPVTWTYAYGAGTLTLTASVVLGGLTQPSLNLPFVLEDPAATLTNTVAGTAVFSAGSGAVSVQWTGGTASITQPLVTGVAGTTAYPVTCLRIPLQQSGQTWSRTIRFTVMP